MAPDPKATTTQMDEDFESVRQASLRAFEVILVDGSTERVFAHFHDSGVGPGHLSFVTIDTEGRQIISRVFNVHVWKDLKEVTTADQQTQCAKAKLHVLRTERNVERRLNPDQGVNARRKRFGVH